VFDLKAEAVVLEVPYEGGAPALSFSSDGSILMVRLATGVLRVFHVSSGGEMTRVAAPGAVTSMVIPAGNRQILIASSPGDGLPRLSSCTDKRADWLHRQAPADRTNERARTDEEVRRVSRSWTDRATRTTSSRSSGNAGGDGPAGAMRRGKIRPLQSTFEKEPSMRIVQRVLWCVPVFVVAAAGLRAGPTANDNTAMGFGGAVKVGDGEVFVAEAANQFRPGMVYVYRKAGAAWQQAAVLQKPGAPVVGDRFGSSLALDGTRLFVGSGPAEIHVFEKRGAVWTPAGVIASSAVTGGENVQFAATSAAGDWLFVGQQVALAARRGGGPPAAGAAPPAAPAGKVYVFKRDGAGQYAFVTTIAGP
jgi:hypothetical protein